MKKANRKARQEIIDYIISTKIEIDVEPGMCRYNFRCQYNAVHDAIENGDKEIAMCVYLDDGFPIIHFINVDKKGNYTDNTLGHWSSECEFYLVKTISQDHFFHVNEVFTAYRKELKNKLRFFTRLFSDNEF